MSRFTIATGTDTIPAAADIKAVIATGVDENLELTVSITAYDESANQNVYLQGGPTWTPGVGWTFIVARSAGVGAASLNFFLKIIAAESIPDVG